MISFKIIDGYPGYVISRCGIIMNMYTRKVLKHGLSNTGYYQVSLCKEGKRKTYTIHRLLMLAFVPNPENKLCVDHIDRNKQNNHLSNLRWATDSENSSNKTDYNDCNLRKDNKLGERHICFDKRDKKYRVQIRRKDCKVNKHFKTLEEAIIFRDNYLTL
jgi:hypothetical protein